MIDASEADRILACNLLMSAKRSRRKRLARTYTKNITTRLSKEEGFQLSIGLRLWYDPKNDSVYIASSLQYRQSHIHPSTNRRLTCHNQAGIDNLMASRAAVSTRRRQLKDDPIYIEKWHANNQKNRDNPIFMEKQRAYAHARYHIDPIVKAREEARDQKRKDDPKGEKRRARDRASYQKRKEATRLRERENELECERANEIIRKAGLVQEG